MTPCDTGPLIALIDEDDIHHQRCMEALPSLRGPLLTTWPCMTEAMHFLGKAGGWHFQEALWRFVERGTLQLHSATEEEWVRIYALMQQYRDAPMDLADASLVAASEATGLSHIFTLDGHFNAYRMFTGASFVIVP